LGFDNGVCGTTKEAHDHDQIVASWTDRPVIYTLGNFYPLERDDFSLNRGNSRISVVLIHRAGRGGGQHGMAKPYSMDLRERAVAAVLKEGRSRHESAARFGVAPSTVINWVRRFQETGSAAPGRMGRQTQGDLRRAR
jgi:hypothetical protein